MEDTSFKQSLRARFRAQRRNLDDVCRQRQNQRINQEILDLVARESAHSLSSGVSQSPGVTSSPRGLSLGGLSPGLVVSAYLAFDGEPDVRPALQTLSRQGIRVVVPAIVTISGTRRLEFRDWTSERPLVQSSLGIDQPDEGTDVPVQELDIMLMPLVAWDEHGHRLGMGAGYYDRALAGLAGSGRPLRVGVAYAVQKFTGLPADPWDVRLHEVITEEGRFTCVP